MRLDLLPVQATGLVLHVYAVFVLVEIVARCILREVVLINLMERFPLARSAVTVVVVDY